ncbi:transposase, partial [Sphingopyxis flava]|uniref:transposase n=1 Tax=Sphingopyxis flava TaxID=1507287 RepID=UPI003CCBE8D1
MVHATVSAAITQSNKVGGKQRLRYGAKSWKCQRRVVARIEASTLGMDIRYVVTS